MKFDSHLKHDDCDYDQKQESHSSSICNDQRLIGGDYELNPNFSLLAEKIQVVKVVPLLLWNEDLKCFTDQIVWAVHV